ncbi:MAG: hypothetical protein K0M74_08000 [Sphingopyxis sp.]|nr:hypothetical protein [Sphingopyxis sp.]
MERADIQRVLSRDMLPPITIVCGCGDDPEDWLSRTDAALVEKFDSAFKHHLDRYKYAGR